MTDAELARMVILASQSLETAQTAIASIADALAERIGADDVDPGGGDTLTHDGTADPTTCTHPVQIKVIGDVTICDSCGTNLKAGVPIDF